MIVVPYTEGQWVVTRASARVAAKAGYGSVFSTSQESYGDVLVSDATVGYRAIRTASEDDIDNDVFGTLWGVSVRLLVRVYGYRSSTKIALPVVAAKAELGTLSAEYSLEVLGGDLKTFAAMLRSVPSIGKFDKTTFEKITSACGSVLETMLVGMKEDTQLLPIRVGVGSGSLTPDSFIDARTKAFALNMIAAGATLHQTLDFCRRKQLFEHAEGRTLGYDKTALRLAYEEFLGLPSVSEPIGDDMKDRARRWLHV